MEPLAQSVNCSTCLFWSRLAEWTGTCQCTSALASNTTTDSQYRCPQFKEKIVALPI